MVALKDSITKENLLKAFAGECQAWRRYEFAASKAKKQTLEVLYWLFHYTGSQEKEHAEVFYNHLKEFNGQEISLSADYPVDNSDNILELLQLAAKREAAEHDTIYKSFGDKANAEGFPDIANSFFMIAEIEQVHSQRFARYAQLMQNNRLSQNDTPIEYICLNCGYIYKATGAPQICPVCGHSQGTFVRREDSPFSK
ncbi:MAG: rubrerythrin family protein [Ethanoligenens sp.]|uniref:rubrerythrin family protein n=1 Tax=Ethanoligenens sp. TaxID=2099655 RepID=UPI0039E7A7D0